MQFLSRKYVLLLQNIYDANGTESVKAMRLEHHIIEEKVAGKNPTMFSKIECTVVLEIRYTSSRRADYGVVVLNTKCFAPSR